MHLTYLHKKNRPTRINIDHSVNGIGLKGIGQAEGNRHWYLLLLLLHIIHIVFVLHIFNIVFLPRITEGMTIFFKQLIAEHHDLFTELYSMTNLIPKHHSMIHYPECIRQIDPLVHVRTMRYEAKEFFKSEV